MITVVEAIVKSYLFVFEAFDTSKSVGVGSYTEKNFESLLRGSLHTCSARGSGGLFSTVDCKFRL